MKVSEETCLQLCEFFDPLFRNRGNFRPGRLYSSGVWPLGHCVLAPT